MLANVFDDPGVAARYDEFGAAMFEPAVLEPAVDLLAELAGDGGALELAVGTGRVALPLAARGVPVAGIELSAAMAEGLRAKDPTGTVAVTIGDMTTTRVEGAFRLVYLVYNTIGNVWTQDAQVACFLNAAAHLEPGGCFVIEVGVPELRRLPPGGDAIVFAHAPGYVGYDRYVDLVAQQAVSHHFHAGHQRGERVPDPIPLRLAVRARPHGPPGRHVIAPPLGGVGPRTVHRCEPLARLGVAVAGLTWQTRSPGAPQVNPPRHARRHTELPDGEWGVRRDGFVASRA